MLFASASRASVNREWDDKRTPMRRARKTSNEYLNTFCVNCTLCLTCIHLNVLNRFSCFPANRKQFLASVSADRFRLNTRRVVVVSTEIRSVRVVGDYIKAKYPKSRLLEGP